MSRNTQLSAETRAKIAAFVSQTAKLYGAEGTQEFTIAPSMLQSLNELLVLDGSPFLQQINVMPVTELKGEKVFLSTTGLVSGRALIDATHERVPTDPSDLSNKQYELHSIESDVALSYAKIDAWAKFPNFAALWNATVRQAIANDRVKVGWHGVEAAEVTDKSTNPNGEDVSLGWLEQIRVYNGGAQYVDGSGGAVLLGGTEFPNLDYLVNITKSRIDPVFINDPDLVAFVSQDLASYEEAQFYLKAGRKAEDKTALLQPNQLLRNYGGLPSFSIPFMPAGTILVTSYNNLSIYYQDTSWRRLIRDYAPKKRYEDFTSRNEGYVVEDLRKASLVDGITLSPTPLIAE